MKTITCIEDLRTLARRRVPRAFFDYADSGSYSEETLRANRADLEHIKLRQRVLVDVSDAQPCHDDPRSEGRRAICAGADRADAACSTATARSSRRKRPMTPASRTRCRRCRSARSRTSRRRRAEPFWFQLYVIKDRGFSKDILARAAQAKCSALVLTVDLQVLGQRHTRHQERHDGAAGNPLENIIDIATKPAWAWSILKGKRKTFGNLAGHVKGMENVNSLAHLDPGAVRSGALLEGRRVDQEHLAGQADPQGHSRRRRRQDRGQARRRRHRGVEPWRPPARRRAVVDLGAAGGRRRGRRRHRSAVRRRHPHRRRRHARAGARRARLPDRPRLCLRPRRRRAGRRRQGDRHPQEGARASPWR